MVGRKPKLSMDQIKTLRQWAAIGCSTTEAAEHFGIARTTLLRYVKQQHKRRYERA